MSDVDSADVASTDVLVIGGGPAGLAVAIGARLAGLGVTVVERSHPPIDKPCGEGLMPPGLAALEALGVRLDPLHRFRGIRYVDGPIVAEGRFRGAGGAGVRRTRLHAAMAERAAELGVDLRWGVRVTGLMADGDDFAGVETAGGPLHARFLVGADGLRSKVRTWAGLALPSPPHPHDRYGIRRHYAARPWTDCVEVHWADAGEAYVTPLADEEVGVAMLWSGRKAGFDDLLAAFPALRERLAGASAVSRDRGTGPLRQRVRRAVRGNLALVGDAAGYLDAITGEGLALGLQQAAALVEALTSGDLELYTRRHARLGLGVLRLTALLLEIERRPWLRRRMVRLLARFPGLFSAILDRLLATT